MQPRLFTLALAALVAVLASAAPAAAQGGVGHSVVDPHQLCPRRYVDPVAGSDVTGTGTIGNPYQTLTFAMAVAPQPSVIILLPGVYGPSTNGESWPLLCRDEVSIQGTSVLNTILVGEGFDVLTFFSSMQFEFEKTQYDGFSIKDAFNAILINDEVFACWPTFSNLFLVDNEVGIHTAVFFLGPDASPDDTDNNGYVEERYRCVNCTIADNEIGILDEVFGPGGPFGEAEPCILNTIVYSNTASDLEGIDDTDIAHTVFCTSDAAGISMIKAGKPAPISHLFICGFPAAALYVDAASCDYRQRPMAPTVDEGSTTDLVCHAGDPTPTHVRTMFPCGQKLFDVDGEEFCNPRVEGGVIDIGADELGQMIVAGYIPLTTTFGTDPATGTVYNTLTLYMTPQPALGGSLSAIVVPGVTSSLAWRPWVPAPVPGARPDGTTIPTPRAPFGLLCIDESTLRPLVVLSMPPVGTPLLITLNLPAAPFRFNLQLIPANDLGSVGVLSNLQSMFVTP